MFCECGKAVKGFQGLGGHRRVCPLRAGRRADVATDRRPRPRAGQVSQTSSLSSLESRLRSPVRALPASTPVQSSSLDEEERQIRARELEVRRQRLEADEAATLHHTREALQAEIARADARAEADQQRQREAKLAERARREAQAEVERRVRLGDHVCSLTAIAHWRDRLPVAIEDAAKARVREALKDAPAGATETQLRAIAEHAAAAVYQHARDSQENAPTKPAAATPAAPSLTSPLSQEHAAAPRVESPARNPNDEVDGDDDDDECPECGDVLELEDGEDDDERVGASGAGLGGLLLVGGVIAACAWLAKKVTGPPEFPVVDPTGQSPAVMRAAPPPSAAPAGYHFETTAAGATVLVRDGFRLA
jgi:hypothetical protein